MASGHDAAVWPGKIVQDRSGNLIVSVHIPKTGGTNLTREIRAGKFGRFLIDRRKPAPFGSKTLARAGDAVSRLGLRLKRSELLRDYDIVHGHFPVRKYAFLHPEARFITFLRDPVARTLSAYYYLKYVASRNPASVRHNPMIQQLVEGRISLLEFGTSPTMVRAYQEYTRGLPLERFTLIGITERYTDSLHMLDALFGVRLELRHERRNDHREHEDEYGPLLPALRAAHRANIGIYERALGLFESRLREVGGGTPPRAMA